MSLSGTLAAGAVRLDLVFVEGLDFILVFFATLLAVFLVFFDRTFFVLAALAFGDGVFSLEMFSAPGTVSAALGVSGASSGTTPTSSRVTSGDTGKSALQERRESSISP